MVYRKDWISECISVLATNPARQRLLISLFCNGVKFAATALLFAAVVAR